MKITSVKQILEDAELTKEFENAKSDEELEELIEKYDFSEFEASELNEEELETVAGGLIMPQNQPYDPTWLWKFAKKLRRKQSKESYSGGGGGGGGHGF